MVDRKAAPRFLLMVIFASLLVLVSQNMTIAGTSGIYDNDKIITHNVEAAISADLTLKRQSIAVATDAAVVVLTGTVANQDVETHAVKVVSAIEGVKFVKDKLAVTGNENPSAVKLP